MIATLSPEAMERAIKLFGADEPAHPKHAPEKGQFDLKSYLENHRIVFKIKTNGAGTLYILDQCLFDPSHSGGEASIIQGVDGVLRYQCFHNSCKSHTWKEARAIISRGDILRQFTDSPRERSEKSPKKTGSIRAVTVEQMLTMEFKPQETLLAPWLNSQGLTMIHASRGVGKTMVGIGVAIAVAGGGTFLKWPAPKARGVLYLDGEMPGGVLQTRIAEAIKSSDVEPVAPLKIITPDLQEAGMPNLSTEEGQELIEPHLEGVSLIVVDNISTLCRGGRENEGESWLPLQEWALRLRAGGFSVLFIHHDGKGGQQRGTSRKEDVLDTVIHLKHPGDYRPEEGARFEVHFEKARMIFGDAVKSFEAQLFTNSCGVQDWAIKTVEESLTKRVADLLNEGIPQNEIFEMMGVSKGTVSKHKAKARGLGMLKK